MYAFVLAAVPSPIALNCGVNVVPRSLVTKVFQAGAALLTPSPVCVKNFFVVVLLLFDLLAA
jgi:hypothetical protein